VLEQGDPAPLVVGLSSNAVEGAASAAGLDGIGTYTLALEAALRARDVRVERIGAPAGWRMRRPAAAARHMPVPLAAGIAWSALTGLPAPASARAVRGIDVYHATDYRVPRLASVPVVATLYDAIPLRHPEWANRRLRRVKNWLLRQAARNADRIITISQAVREEVISEFGVDAGRVHVVYPGVGEQWFAGRSDTDASMLGATGVGGEYLLCVGTLQPRKNVACLVEAYDALPASLRARHPLVIVGKYGWGAEALRDELVRRRAQGRGNDGPSAGRVVWLEYVPFDTLLVLYRNARAFVFPSLAEGFGLPVVEALASGLPVVSLDLPVMREVGGPHVTPASGTTSTDLAVAMQATLAGTPDAEAVREARRSWARRFSWRRCADETIAVYREAMAQRS
jgi:glycosyltransferase involved in cell wall biosynthesis